MGSERYSILMGMSGELVIGEIVEGELWSGITGGE